MKEVSWSDVQKQNANVKVAKTVAIACIGKKVDEAVRLLKLNKVKYRTNEDGDFNTKDEVDNRVNLDIVKGVVKKAFLG